MNVEEVYEEVLPYLSDPREIKEFLERHKESSLEDIIQHIREKMGDSEVGLKTDFRILLNALEKPE